MLWKMEASTTPGTEDDFKPKKTNVKREVDIRKEWLSTQHQAIGKQVACNPLE